MNREQSILAAQDLIEALKKLPEDIEFYDLNTVMFYVNDLDQMIDFRRRLGGRWEKIIDDTWVTFSQITESGTEFQIFSHRSSICSRIVVGKEIVEVTDPNAPKIQVEKDIVEWVCPESLMSQSASVSGSA